MPDGKLWQASSERSDEALTFGLARGFGSWAAVAGIEHASVGVQSNGTLWCSVAGISPPMMEQVGAEVDWKTVISQPHGNSVLLLKTNGTLWRWGTCTNRSGPAALRQFPIHRIDDASDWSSVLSGSFNSMAWKTNGEAWLLVFTTNLLTLPHLLLDPEGAMHRIPAMDGTKWRSEAFPNFGVRADGTFWRFGGNITNVGHFQIGADANWDTAVLGNIAEFEPALVARKTDGTLWTWKGDFDHPVQIWSHNQWVGLGLAADRSILALAADGGVWNWRMPETPDTGAWLAPSRRPMRVGNVFDPR